MKILITGVNGFIGQHLSETLLKRGHAVVGLGRSSTCTIPNITKYYSGSVLNKTIVKKAALHVDVIVHLAALTAHKDIIDNKFQTLEINLEGTKAVLDVFTKSKTARKFLYSSTGKVYGNIKELPITEEHPAEPLNILGKSKLIAEKLIDFYNDNERQFFIFRVFNIYGPKQKQNFLLPTILKQLDQKEITLGDTEAKRDYVYIDDLVNAFVQVIEKNGKRGITIYNICTGIGSSAGEIVKEIGLLLGKAISIKHNKALLRHDEVDFEFGSYAKIKNDFAWEPKYTLREGLKQILKK